MQVGKPGYRTPIDGNWLLTICSDAAHLAREAARRITLASRRNAKQHGRFSICLSGGSTPREAYSLLGSESHRSGIPWRQVHVFWGDERCLPVDHADNHYRLAYNLFLSRVPIPAENIHRIRGEAADPEQAAAEYEDLLRSFFGLVEGEIPRFDLILLGMGADGHTASLFPGTTALAEQRRLVVANFVSRLGLTRITLTLPVLNQAQEVLFLVAGESKAEALLSAWDDWEGSAGLPVGRVRPAQGRVEWLVDAAAAVRLGRRAGSAVKGAGSR